MKIKKNILIIAVLLLCSCNGKKEKQETEPLSGPKIESKTETKSELDNDYSKSAELFAKDVLKENIRIHSFDLASSENPKHLRIFQSDGLENIVAYSNKNYPKKTIPYYYEHFTLFVATFNSEENAKKNFGQIKSDSKYGLTDWRALDNGLSERVKALNIGAKPGGMITQTGKQVFSLVETCREAPINGNWIDYEKRFIKFLKKSDDEEFEILNSDCGMDKYQFKIIKAGN